MEVDKFVHMKKGLWKSSDGRGKSLRISEIQRIVKML